MIKKHVRSILVTIMLFCFTMMVLLPVFVQAQHNNEKTNLDLNLLDDPKERSIYFFRKGVFYENSDVHYFSIPLREGKKYVGRIWVTAPEGGDIILRLIGDTTYSQVLVIAAPTLKNDLLELNYTSDATITGSIRITYVNMVSTQKPTYTLYVNQAGFAGLWWIILSGIGILAVLTVLLTFAIIGMRSVAKKRQKKR
jgi:hypothetical protein